MTKVKNLITFRIDKHRNIVKWGLTETCVKTKTTNFISVFGNLIRLELAKLVGEVTSSISKEVFVNRIEKSEYYMLISTNDFTAGLLRNIFSYESHVGLTSTQIEVCYYFKKSIEAQLNFIKSVTTFYDFFRNLSKDRLLFSEQLSEEELKEIVSILVNGRK